MTIATPSWWWASATNFAYFQPSGWPSDIAQERSAHCSIEKSFGLSPKLTQSSLVNHARSAIFARVCPLLTPTAEISISDSLKLE